MRKKILYFCTTCSIIVSLDQIYKFLETTGELHNPVEEVFKHRGCNGTVRVLTDEEEKKYYKANPII